jgi:hypothetical protein
MEQNSIQKFNSFSDIVNNNNPGKKALKEMAGQMVNQFIEAEDDVLKIAEAIYKLELFTAEIRADKKFVETVLDELQKRGFKSRFELPGGTKIEEIEAGVKYDFSGCGDPIWAELTAKKNEVADALKSREAFLKLLPGSGESILDESTGEVRKIYPPAKSSTTTFKITVPNN